MRAMASSRSPPHAINLPSIGSYSVGTSSLVDAVIQADAGAGGAARENLARRREEIIVRIFGVDAALDGVAAQLDILLREREAARPRRRESAASPDRAR